MHTGWHKATLSVPNLGLCRVDVLREGHPLILGADHASDGHFLGEVQLGDALEALLEVGLHTQRVFGLRQDLQQLVIGQEEEPGNVRKVKRRKKTKKHQSRPLENC